MKAAVLTVATAASAAVLGMGPAASAAPQACPANSVCGWSGANFTGMMRPFPVGAGCVNATPALRSVANTFPRGTGVQPTAHVHSGPDCGGRLVAVVRPGDGVPVLSSPGTSLFLSV
ncbi:peptidase inhibitor family I36 protein [Actinomadura kijaniata]|uniref:peptidase inhibitor family I36 protein n=1 Tax=Actinomadura kijaniata TaxID=46161 RepID=UPI003F1AECF8